VPSQILHDTTREEGTGRVGGGEEERLQPTHSMVHPVPFTTDVSSPPRWNSASGNAWATAPSTVTTTARVLLLVGSLYSWVLVESQNCRPWEIKGAKPVAWLGTSI
jgi:hypothetical protein